MRNSKSKPNFPLSPEKYPLPKPTNTLVKDSGCILGQITVSGANPGWSQSLALCRECPYLCMATLLKTLNSLGNQKGTHRKMYKDAEAANRLVPALVSL